MNVARSLLALAVASSLLPSHGNAQERRRSLDLKVGGYGISIGDSRRVNGLRLNFRDSRLEEVNGINVTIWHPYRDGGGRITGLAMGVPSIV